MLEMTTVLERKRNKWKETQKEYKEIKNDYRETQTITRECGNTVKRENHWKIDKITINYNLKDTKATKGDSKQLQWNSKWRGHKENQNDKKDRKSIKWLQRGANDSKENKMFVKQLQKWPQKTKKKIGKSTKWQQRDITTTKSCKIAAGICKFIRDTKWPQSQSSPCSLGGGVGPFKWLHPGAHCLITDNWSCYNGFRCPQVGFLAAAVLL